MTGSPTDRAPQAPAPTLFVMVGLSGSGRTTLAKALEQQHGAQRLTKDDWMMPLFGWGEFEDERPIVEGLLWATGARALQLGVDVVLDHGLWARAEREDYRARALALGARVDVRFLDVPDDELFFRLEARPPGADRRADHAGAAGRVDPAVRAADRAGGRELAPAVIRRRTRSLRPARRQSERPGSHGIRASPTGCGGRI